MMMKMMMMATKWSLMMNMKSVEEGDNVKCVGRADMRAKRKRTLRVEESSLLQNQEGSRSEMIQMKSIKEVNVLLCFAVFVGLLKER